MKKFISLLIFMLVALTAGTSFAFDVPQHNGFVNDYANKLTADQLSSLNAKVQSVNTKTANEIGVMIIPSLNGESIDDVAHQTFNKWGVGKANLDNGVLLVIAVNDRKMRIETGKGVEGDLTDLQTQDIQSHMKSYLRKNDFYGAVNLAVSEIGSSIESRRQQHASATAHPAAGCQVSSATGYGLGIVAVVVLAFVFVVRYARRLARKEMEEAQRKSQAEAAKYLASLSRHIEAVKSEKASVKPVKKETLNFSPVYEKHAPSQKVAKAKPVSKPKEDLTSTKPSVYSPPAISTYTPPPPDPTPSYDWSSSSTPDFGGGFSGGGGSSSDW